MRSVHCEPAINEVCDPVKQCKQYEEEIQFLKNELAMHDTLTNRGQVVYEPLSESQRNEVKRQVEKYVAREIAEMEIVNVRQIREMLEIFRDLVNDVEKKTEERLREKYIFQEKSLVENQDVRGMFVSAKYHDVYTTTRVEKCVTNREQKWAEYCS